MIINKKITNNNFEYYSFSEVNEVKKNNHVAQQIQSFLLGDGIDYEYHKNKIQQDIMLELGQYKMIHSYEIEQQNIKKIQKYLISKDVIQTKVNDRNKKVICIPESAQHLPDLDCNNISIESQKHVFKNKDIKSKIERQNKQKVQSGCLFIESVVVTVNSNFKFQQGEVKAKIKQLSNKKLQKIVFVSETIHFPKQQRPNKLLHTKNNNNKHYFDVNQLFAKPKQNELFWSPQKNFLQTIPSSIKQLNLNDPFSFSSCEQSLQNNPSQNSNNYLAESIFSQFFKQDSPEHISMKRLNNYSHVSKPQFENNFNQSFISIFDQFQ